MLLPIAAALCLVAAPPSSPTQRAKHVFDSPLFSAPDSVRVRRLRYPADHGVERYADTEPVGPYRPISTKKAAELVPLLRKAAALQPMGKTCGPVPACAIEFRKGRDHADVLICFQCDELAISRAEPGDWIDFDPYRPQILRWVRSVFPRDPVFKKL